MESRGISAPTPARLEPIKSRCPSVQPETEGRSVIVEGPLPKSKEKQVHVDCPDGPSPLCPRMEKARMSETYGASFKLYKLPGVCHQKPKGTTLDLTKNRRMSRLQYNKHIMDQERRKAAAYRESSGRRNACDFGKLFHGPKRNRKESYEPRCKSVVEEREGAVNDDEERSKSSLPSVSLQNRYDDNSIEEEGDIETIGLTKRQIKAFREVFDLFDSNGGGSIDAEELDEALRSVNINLSRDEIFEVLKIIDKDGNGEIDFAEFLQLMTNTERFIEALTVNTDEATPYRETLLFDALTEFMKKSALHSMDELVGYYSHKYKRAQIPHVVNHYAAGARLIGLTERQLKERLERLKASNFGSKSPYAEPLHILTSSTDMPVLSKFPRPRRQGRIKLFIKVDDKANKQFAEASGTKDSYTNIPFPNYPHVRHFRNQLDLPSTAHKHLHHVPVSRRGLGWVSQRTEHIEVALPSSHLRKLVPFDDLTANDLPEIRSSVCDATQTYIKERRQTQLQDNYKHWQALQVNLISPKILQKHFRAVYSVYSLVGQRHLTVPDK